MERKQKGITLIALVITIIVLLILAGVTINLTIGNNGIFKLAEDASEKYQNKAEQEKYDLAKAENQIESYVDGTRNNEKGVVLWENPNDSTTAFEAQTITLSTDQYDYIEVLYRYCYNEPDFCVMKMYKGYTFSLNAGSRL